MTSKRSPASSGPSKARVLAPSREDLDAVTAARWVALDVLEAVRNGAPADDALAATLRVIPHADADRGLAQELVYGVLRARRRIDSILLRYCRSGLPTHTGALDAMRIAAHAMLALDRVPVSASVNTAVESVKRRGAAFASGFVNATLRALSREVAAVRAEKPPASGATIAALAEWYSFPDFLVDAFARIVPDRTALIALLEASNRPALLSLRAIPPETAGGLAAKLAAFGAHKAEFARDAVVLDDPGVPGKLPGFAEGNFAIQDEAAQLVTELLEPLAGVNLLDVCAAPGGKAIHAAQLGAKVLALDADPHRLTRAREAATRLHATVEWLACEVGAAPIAPLVGRKFERVLVDAPCSATGILRRKPDAKWFRSPSDLARLSRDQLAILRGASHHVSPGGTLVYAVCSLVEDEGEAVVEAFLVSEEGRRFRKVALSERHAAFATPRGFFRSLPSVHGTDGFFAARLICDADQLT